VSKAFDSPIPRIGLVAAPLEPGLRQELRNKRDADLGRFRQCRITA